MRKKFGNVLWGLIFIALGLVFVGKVLLGWDFEVFFDGWWTLFIIVPCLISFIQNGFNTGAIVGLIFGVILFLDCNDLVRQGSAFRLIIPVILIAIGVKLIFRNNFAKKVENHINFNQNTQDTSYTHESTAYTEGNTSYGTDNIERGANYSSNNEQQKQTNNNSGFQTGAEHSAFFSSNRINYGGEVFRGTSANAVFGGIVIDLRGAIIEQDSVINATAIFGGIDIYVPYGVRIKVDNVPIFGGVSNKVAGQVKPDAPTIYLQSTCMFGGIDIK